MTLVLDEISFWNLFEAFLGCLFTHLQFVQFLYVSLSDCYLTALKKFAASQNLSSELCIFL